jgi:hypothetical protein
MTHSIMGLIANHSINGMSMNDTQHNVMQTVAFFCYSEYHTQTTLSIIALNIKTLSIIAL